MGRFFMSSENFCFERISMFGMRVQSVSSLCECLFVECLERIALVWPKTSFWVLWNGGRPHYRPSNKKIGTHTPPKKKNTPQTPCSNTYIFSMLNYHLGLLSCYLSSFRCDSCKVFQPCHSLVFPCSSAWCSQHVYFGGFSFLPYGGNE